MVTDLFKIDELYNSFDKMHVLLLMAWRGGFIQNSKNHLGDLNKHYVYIEKQL